MELGIYIVAGLAACTSYLLFCAPEDLWFTLSFPVPAKPRPLGIFGGGQPRRVPVGLRDSELLSEFKHSVLSCPRNACLPAKDCMQEGPVRQRCPLLQHYCFNHRLLLEAGSPA